MPRLSISLLGPFQVTLGRDPVIAFESDKVRALLAYLAAESDRPHRREKLAGLLWPERTERSARQNLSQALFNLRRIIGDRDAEPQFLLITPRTLQFNRSSDYRLDVATFEALLAACETHPHRRLEACGSCADRLRQAVALYRGAFLEGFSLGNSSAFEEWALLEQERLHRLVMDSLCHLANRHERRSEYGQMLEHAWRQVALDPWREEAHRQAMRALALNGRRSEALAQYETCRRALEEEVGVEPEEETTTLYERIRDGMEVLPHVPAPPNNLPAALTPFVGREKELAQIKDRLEDISCRLLTLVGPGGIGKTRLALEAAAAQGIQFSHGVFLTPLAPLSSVDGITHAVAETIGFSFHRESEPEQQLRDYLRQREMLLIMDNFEHLLSRPGLDEGSDRRDGADWVLDVLKAAPGLTILATSRVRLNIQGEHVFPIGGMGFPDRKGADDAIRYKAVELFLQTARRVRPDFAPTDRELSDVAEICRLVQGMPLGILLAAPWVERFTLAEIAVRISRHSLDLLATDLRGIPERQRSIQATFDHSWELLTEREQDVLRQLSIFRGGCTQEAAREVVATTPEVLTVLADRSLLQHTPQDRYEMHPLVRQYAAEKLAQSPDAGDAVRDRHCAYYAALLQRLEADLKGTRQQTALREIGADIENARAAWNRAIEQAQIERLDQAIEGLCRFYVQRCRYREGETACRAAAERLALLPHRLAARVWAKTLKWQGVFTLWLGHVELAGELLQQGLTLLESLELTGQDTRAERAAILGEMGAMAFESNLGKAGRLLDQSLRLYDTLDDPWGKAAALSGLTWVAMDLGDYDKAKQSSEQGLAIRQALDDRKGISRSLMQAGFVALHRGQAAECERLIRESITLRREIGGRAGIANGLINLAQALLWLGKFGEAHAPAKESVAICNDLGLDTLLSLAATSLGRVKMHLGQYKQARARGRMGLALAREVGVRTGIGNACRLLGCVALAETTCAEAQEWLEKSAAAHRESEKRGPLILALAALGVAARGLGQRSQARQHLYKALQTAVEMRAFYLLVTPLLAIALLLTDQGQQEQAVELYALASRYPYVANSRWFEDVFGHRIAAVAAALPPDVVAAAQERGRARDPRATAAELLEELEK